VRGGFDLTAAKAVFMGLLVMLTSVLISIAAFRNVMAEPSRRRGRRQPDLVVARADGPLEP
jgi:hypothetical protein